MLDNPHAKQQRAAKPIVMGHFSSRRSGFALVIALSLTALMLMAVMSLSAFTLVEARNAVQREQQALATQNAVLGLQLALGELQRTAGLDQRVTARADIVDASSPNPEWTGVWATFDPDYVPATTTTQLWELERFRNWSLNTTGPRWLVSSSQVLGATLDPSLPANSPVNNPPIPGYAGSPLQAMARRAGGDAVMAGRIPLREDRSGQALSGMVAWWVADEGVKARVFNTLEHEADGSDWYEAQTRSASPPPLDGGRTDTLNSSALASATGRKALCVARA